MSYTDKQNLLVYVDERGRFQPVRTPADWAIRARHIRTRMERVMGPLPAITSEPLGARIRSETRIGSYWRWRLSFLAEPGDRIPAYLLVPDRHEGQRLPGLICLPGSSTPGKDIPAGVVAMENRAFAHELAQRGYVALVLDYPLRHTQEYSTNPYDIGYISASMKGIVNHRRGVDLLQSLPFVDPGAIGAIGHSLGGHNSLFLAVFEERIGAIVTSCGFNTFAKYKGGDLTGWSSRYYMPLIASDYGKDPERMPFDFPEVLAALAPRPLFINAPLNDDNFEVSGVRDCVTAALPVYDKVFGAAGNLVAEYPAAGHDFPPEVRQSAYRFLDRHLKRVGA